MYKILEKNSGYCLFEEVLDLTGWFRKERLDLIFHIDNISREEFETKVKSFYELIGVVL